MDESEAVEKLILAGELPTQEAIQALIKQSNIQTQTKEILECKRVESKNDGGVEILSFIETFPKKYEVKDFVEYFRSKYSYLKELLSNRPELSAASSISKLQQGEKTAIIATVYDIKKLPTGTLKLQLEDMTGSISAIISQKNKELFEKARLITHDAVLGFKGSVGKDIFFVDDVVWPDIPYKNINKTIDEVYVACLPDLHIGSKLFLEKEFNKFLKWLQGAYGNERQRKIGLKTKYIIICGDLVDGVGIYPTQEKELLIKDIYKQYEAAAELLSKIPNDRYIIISPGNHDAVRKCEPQPPLSKKFAVALYNLPNTIMVSNPCYLKLHKLEHNPGVDFLIYHGDSFDYFIDNVESLRLAGGYDAANKVWEFLLKQRHLAPTYGATLALPFDFSHLLIKQIPDVVMSGHIHKAKIGKYKGVLIVSGGCWQATTTFQQKLGHKPHPCSVPIINLSTGEAKIFKFK
jgi:DNA polymerase II small subunit